MGPCLRVATIIGSILSALFIAIEAEATELRLYCSIRSAGGQSNDFNDWIFFVDRFVCRGTDCLPGKELDEDSREATLSAQRPDFRAGGKFDQSALQIYRIGCGGTAVWEFQNNAVTDVDGFDIIVFESGSAKEGMKVELSNDLRNWLEIGRIEGGVSGIDIGWKGEARASYRYLRLTDLYESCRNKTPGAEIDAIATCACSPQLPQPLVSTAHFTSGQAEPDSSALLQIYHDLSRLADDSSINFRLEGRADAVGDEQENLELSRRRVHNVAVFLSSIMGISSHRLQEVALGESVSLDSNKTSAGRARNRSVIVRAYQRGCS